MSRERERYWEEDEIGKRLKREIDAAAAVAAVISKYQVEIMGRRQMTAAMTEDNNEDHHHHHKHQLNSITPCAACKLLRRRCAEECPFSPYFSPHEPHKFAAVHKVFGASNVSKMLMEVPENQRADAANSLVYEANVRLRDPVYGCMGAISALQQQLQTLQSELNVVRSQILKCKFREAAAAAASSIISPAAPPTPPPQQRQPTPPSTPPPPPPPPSFASLSTHHHHTLPYFG